MQITSIITLLIAATGAIAAPGKPSKPSKPQKPNVITNQSITCGNGQTAYCCTASADGGDGGKGWDNDGGNGGTAFSCVAATTACTNIAVCCNSNAGGNSNQVCGVFGNAKVTIEND
ncbi:hypothetical protein B0T10DRAFT_608890 [Thelonectria olida]|uniref:Hydrophobin n=1 Tax=Thelonectria olida TaxID=1576542 RepID=A0A9P8W165_9HYPO|nr:hypothetical protein B0T10DRAFT_608890 [Thelonectria olida]